MEEAKERVVHRPQIQDGTGSPAEKKSQGVSWRKISLLATPLVIGIINLVDAYNDRRRAIIESDQEYRVSVESGKAEVIAIISAAEESGRILAATTRETGVQESDSAIGGATEKARQIIEQSLLESELQRLQAEKIKQMLPGIR